MLARTSLVILLTAQAGLAWAAGNAAAGPAEGAALADSPPAGAATLQEPRSIEAVIADFQRTLAQTQAARDTGARIAAYRRSLELLDTVLLDRPDFTFSPGLAPLVVGYVDALNAHRRQIDGAARARNLSESQAVVLRLDDAFTRVAKLLDIARTEAESGIPEQTLATLDGVLTETPDLTTVQRDAALAQAIAITTHLAADPPPRVTLWLEEIRDPTIRAQCLRQIAQAAAARDPALVELMNNMAPGTDRDAWLLDISDFMSRQGRFYAATWSAMLASDRVAGERDAALAVVVGDMIEARSASIPAVHGIADLTLRNRLLLDLVTYHLTQDRVAEARAAASFATPSTEAALAWTRLGLWLAKEDYLQQARAAAGRAEVSLRKAVRSTGARRDAVTGQLAILVAQLGRRQSARALLGSIADPGAAQAARVAVVENALNQGAVPEALAELDRFDPGSARDRAQARCVAALARARRWPEAVELAASISAPLAHMDALVAVLQEIEPGQIKPGEPAPPPVAGLAREIELLVERAVQDGDRAEAMALRAMARSTMGDFALARADLEAASAAQRYRDALVHVAKKQAQTEGAAAALSTVDLAWREGPRARAEVAVAVAAQGEIESAVTITRGLEDERLRVETFRKIAKAAAERRDDADLLGASSPVAAPDDIGRLRKPRLLTAVADQQMFAMPNPELGRILPPMPALRDFTHAAVAADIPEIAPGGIHVIPLHYSDFNEKFLSSMSYAFSDYGGRLFYFDAQKTPFPVFLSLDQGVFDLPAIARHLEATGQSRYLVREGRRYTLNLPLSIGPNAVLVVSGADVEELRLNRNSGTYIVNAGHLIVYDTRITGWDTALGAPAPLDYQSRSGFRPFIVGWSGSVTDIARSIVTHLGFSGAKAYGLTYSSGPDILLKNQAIGLRRPTGRVVDNSFQQMLYGFYSYEADDLAIVGNEYRDNVVYAIDPHDRSERLLIGHNTAYDTAVKHGIIVSRTVGRSWILGNLSFDNRGSGVMLDRASSGNLVYANTAFGNRQDGITLFESPCNILAANLLLRNGRDGIKSRNSWDIGVFGNRVAENRGVAVSSYVADLAAASQGHVRDLEQDPYTKFADIALIDNAFRDNRGGGVNLRGVANLTWKGNSLVSQPKPFGGPVKGFVKELFGHSDDGLYMRTDCASAPADYSCALKSQGFLAGAGFYEPAEGPPPVCVAATRTAATAVPADVSHSKAAGGG